MAYITPNLTRHESELLAYLDRERLTRVTPHDARPLLGRATYKVLSKMAHKGLLDRLTQGVYSVRPLRAIGQPWGISSIVAVQEALNATPYYIGGLAALTLHRLTEQTYSSIVDVFIEKRLRSREMGNARVRFHAVPRSRIERGSDQMQLEGRLGWFSGPEKTLLDALDYPAMYGGIGEAVRTVSRAIAKVDTAKLINFAVELSPASTLQRLGVLLERSGVKAPELTPLDRHLAGVRSEPGMVAGPRTGRFNPRWRIIENDLAIGAQS